LFKQKNWRMNYPDLDNDWFERQADPGSID
jgi:hypothetical protein